MATVSPPPSSPSATSAAPESTLHALSQAPPPSLREILSAYSSRGQGDRDMLVALLNAKSAEDQRLAAVATLHQTVLQMQHALAIAAMTQPNRISAQPSPEAQQPRYPSPKRKRSHVEYESGAYRHDEREPTLPPSPESGASSPPLRSEFPHLSNPSTMSIRTLLHPAKRRRDDRERSYVQEDDYDEYRSHRRPHIVVHRPSAERESYRHTMRTSSARDDDVVEAD